MTDYWNSPSQASPPPGDKSRWPARWLLLLVVAAGVLIGVSVTRSPQRDDAPGEGTGKPLADFDLQPLTGSSQPLQRADLAGRVVLLNFWGTWCPPCQRELPHLVHLIERFEDKKDFLPLLVSCGTGPEDLDELRGETAEFLAQHDYHVPTYADVHQATRRGLVKTAGMRGYPFTAVLDRQSIIRGVWEGYDPDGPQQMAALVEKLLSEPMVKSEQTEKTERTAKSEE